MAAGMSRHEHGDVPDGLRRRRPDRRGRHRPRPGHRRLPDPVAGRHRGRGRDAVPRALPGARGLVPDDVGVLEHLRPSGLPGAVAVRVAGPRGAARPRRPADGHRPRRAAPPQPAAPRRAAVHEPQRDALRRHHADRDLRAGAGDARLRGVPARTGRGPRGRAATWASAPRTYVEPTTTGMAYYATEGATIRIEPSGKVNVYVAGGSTGNSLETTVVQLTADALGVDIADVRTIQGDTAVTPFGAGTGGSRSGSMIAGAIDETASAAARRGSPPSPPTSSRPTPSRHRGRGRPGVRPGHAEHRRLDGRDRRRRLLRAARAARRHPAPGSRPAPATGPAARSSGRTPPTSAPARSTSRPAR